MTEKEKAKAYDAAIERAKKLYGDGIAEGIFPELKESEDDRIRKWIIDDIRYNMNNEPLNNSEYKKKAENAIDWLEKQGRNSTDKNKPSFNVGDWVVLITSKSVYQVEKKENYEYTLRHILGGSLCLPFYNDVLIREWTIEDAKGGDVLCCKSGWMCIFKSLNNHTNTFSSYCFMDSDKCFFNSGGECHTLDKEFINAYNGLIHPATKEQRDTLMKAMNEAGYEWDADKKELKIKTYNL